MCCLVATLFALGPRAAILVWWLIEPVRRNATFDTFVWPLLGLIVAPWTTLMYVVVYPAGINGFDYRVAGPRRRDGPVLLVRRRLHQPGSDAGIRLLRSRLPRRSRTSEPVRRTRAHALA